MTLRHFKANEFVHFDKMDPLFLGWLDEVRERAGIPIIVTSDYRSPERNAMIPGAFSKSLHVEGTAIDLRWPTGKKSLARLLAAIFSTPTPNVRGVQLGLEYSAPGGRHIHLGLFLDGRPNEVFVR